MNSAHNGDGHITATMTQYLLAMYSLRRENQPLIGARLAEWLGIAPASVTEMLKRMGQEGLVQVGRGREIGLTQRGWQIAMSTARRHYLAERLLTDLIGVEWSRARGSRALAVLDYGRDRGEAVGGARTPDHLPARQPDSRHRGVLLPHTRRLTEVEPGEEVIVERIAERAKENIDLLAYFQEHGLVPGERLQVCEASVVTGTLVLQTARGEVTLGTAAATQLMVVPERLFGHRPTPDKLRREVSHAAP